MEDDEKDDGAARGGSNVMACRDVLCAEMLAKKSEVFDSSVYQPVIKIYVSTFVGAGIDPASARRYMSNFLFISDPYVRRPAWFTLVIPGWVQVKRHADQACYRELVWTLVTSVFGDPELILQVLRAGTTPWPKDGGVAVRMLQKRLEERRLQAGRPKDHYAKVTGTVRQILTNEWKRWATITFKQAAANAARTDTATLLHEEVRRQNDYIKELKGACTRLAKPVGAAPDCVGNTRRFKKRGDAATKAADPGGIQLVAKLPRRDRNKPRNKPYAKRAKKAA